MTKRNLEETEKKMRRMGHKKLNGKQKKKFNGIRQRDFRSIKQEHCAVEKKQRTRKSS